MPKDRLLELVSQGDNTTTTQTASWVGTLMPIINYVPLLAALPVRLVYYAAKNTSGSTTVKFTIQDSNTTVSGDFVDNTSVTLPVLTTTAIDNVVEIPFNTRKKYIRLKMDMTGGAGGTITFSAGVAATGN